MLIRRVRKWHQNRRLSCRRDLSDGSRTGPANNDVGLRKRRRHIGDERYHFTFKSTPGEVSCDLRIGIIPGLVKQTHLNGPLEKQGPTFNRCAIQRPRTLAAARDQYRHLLFRNLLWQLEKLTPYRQTRNL